MAVNISIILSREVDDIDKANDFVDEVKELLQGNVTGTLHSSISNHNPPIELTEEPESE